MTNESGTIRGVYKRTGVKRQAVCTMCEAPNLVEEGLAGGGHNWWSVEIHSAHCGLPCYGAPLGSPTKYVHGKNGKCPRCGEVKESRNA